MRKATPEVEAIVTRLRSIGVSAPYASQLARGKRTPSFRLAVEIEEKLGIPLSAWPMAESIAA